MSFDTILVVDWSAAGDRGPRPKADAIWVAVVRGAAADEPRYFRSRPEFEGWVQDLLAAELTASRRVLAGFDFPFGYPTGFSARVLGRPDPLALWDRFAAELPADAPAAERFHLAGRLNALFPGTGPFWFNGLGAEIEGLPRKGRACANHGLPERRLAEDRAKGAFPLWQMGGAGAVGGQAMTGMAALSRLRRHLAGRVAVWPFEPLDKPIALAEVWPSLIAEAVARDRHPDEIKDAAQVRVLAARLATLNAEGRLDATLAAVPDEARREEGWILGLGLPDFAPPAAPRLVPPRLKDDCFALPRGVDWVPVDDALAQLRAGLHPVTAIETVPVAEATGRILAADHVAQRSNPPAPNAAVDGYGFAHAGTGSGPQVLLLHPGRAAAGSAFAGQVPHDRALRILTGAILPAGVDTVVLEEDCTVAEGHIAFEGPVKPGANTRRAGEDVAEGDTALPAGHRLRAMDLALLSALGLGTAQVRARLKVAVLSTGDEIVPPDEVRRPSQIGDANRPMLMALTRGWGHAATDLGIAADNRDAVRDALNRGARDCDAILTSGGASAGDEDHISAILRAEGQVQNWRIALKPGRPMMLGLWRSVPIFGMPGNPVAALVCALVFARPALSVLAGAGWIEPQGFTVPAAFSKRKKPGRREYLRARLTSGGAAEVFASEGSGRISGLSWATGLVELPDGALEVAPGTPVRFLPYSGFGI